MLYTRNGEKVFGNGSWQPNLMVGDNIIHDKQFYTMSFCVVNGIMLYPVTVKGHWSAHFFEGWPGVGYSPVPFKMKAFVDNLGQVWRPAYTFYVDDDTGSQYRAKNAKTYLVPVAGVPDRAITRITPQTRGILDMCEPMTRKRWDKIERR